MNMKAIKKTAWYLFCLVATLGVIAVVTLTIDTIFGKGGVLVLLLILLASLAYTTYKEFDNGE